MRAAIASLLITSAVFFYPVESSSRRELNENSQFDRYLGRQWARSDGLIPAENPAEITPVQRDLSYIDGLIVPDGTEVPYCDFLIAVRGENYNVFHYTINNQIAVLQRIRTPDRMHPHREYEPVIVLPDQWLGFLRAYSDHIGDGGWIVHCGELLLTSRHAGRSGELTSLPSMPYDPTVTYSLPEELFPPPVAVESPRCIPEGRTRRSRDSSRLRRRSSSMQNREAPSSSTMSPPTEMFPQADIVDHPQCLPNLPSIITRRSGTSFNLRRRSSSMQDSETPSSATLPSPGTTFPRPGTVSRPQCLPIISSILNRSSRASSSQSHGSSHSPGSSNSPGPSTIAIQETPRTSIARRFRQLVLRHSRNRQDKKK